VGHQVFVRTIATHLRCDNTDKILLEREFIDQDHMNAGWSELKDAA
jgi:hypothetical protein